MPTTKSLLAGLAVTGLLVLAGARIAPAQDPTVVNAKTVRVEGRRFPICRPDALRDPFTGASLDAVVVDSLTIPTVFASFEEYWGSFLDGPGPVPTYVSSLSQEARQRLAERLRNEISPATDGSIRLQARAWAVNA